MHGYMDISHMTLDLYLWKMKILNQLGTTPTRGLSIICLREGEGMVVNCQYLLLLSIVTILIIFHLSFALKKPQTPGPHTIAFSPRHGKLMETLMLLLMSPFELGANTHPLCCFKNVLSWYWLLVNFCYSNKIWLTDQATVTMQIKHFLIQKDDVTWKALDVWINILIGVTFLFNQTSIFLEHRDHHHHIIPA